ncbi:MAG: hypothetical protein ACWGSD_16855, partial [Thermodesulfobacteriota bacterium]
KHGSETSVVHALEPGEHLEELVGILQKISENLAASGEFWDNANRFAHGFIHSQFQEELGHHNLVDNIEISDQFLDLHTRGGTPTVYVALRVDTFNLDTERGREEISTTISLEHVFHTGNGAANPIISQDLEGIDDGEGTPPRYYGVFPAKMDWMPQSLIAAVKTVEKDGPGLDDRYTTEFFNVPGYDRNALIARA